jgi:arsenate reductase
MNTISQQRKEVLLPFVNYLVDKLQSNQLINLIFICTHNSRRSQLAQVWAMHYAEQYNISINSFSGGTEVTACNERTIASLKRSGFEINQKDESTNPNYEVTVGSKNLALFSKLYDDTSNPTKDFAAIMTCSHAEQNCPFIPGASKRISIPYDDPKEFDDTDLEASKYDERSQQIAQEMEFVFTTVNEIIK